MICVLALSQTAMQRFGDALLTLIEDEIKEKDHEAYSGKTGWNEGRLQ
jgi:hypothetical protein